jgi:glycosyltransferase involved in cell wall biosynthesis
MSKVSIIVPVHNTEKYLENTVRSLLAQTLKDIEIILVENASTDGSLALCHELAKTDDRIKVMHLEKGDLSYARNNGLTLATSEYVAFVDSDDTVKPEMYETLLGIAQEHNLDLVYSNIMKVYDNRPPKYIYTEDEKVLVMTPKEMLIKNFTHKINVNACTMIARKHLFDNLKFPEDMYFEDRAFTFRLINATSKVGYINKAFYHYYQRSGSIVHLKNWKNGILLMVILLQTKREMLPLENI